MCQRCSGTKLQNSQPSSFRVQHRRTEVERARALSERELLARRLALQRQSDGAEAPRMQLPSWSLSSRASVEGSYSVGTGESADAATVESSVHHVQQEDSVQQQVGDRVAKDLKFGGFDSLFETAFGLQMAAADRAQGIMPPSIHAEASAQRLYDLCEENGVSRFYARFLREGARRGDGAFEHSNTQNAVRWLEATFPRTQRHRRTVKQSALPPLRRGSDAAEEARGSDEGEFDHHSTRRTRRAGYRPPAG